VLDDLKKVPAGRARGARVAPERGAVCQVIPRSNRAIGVDFIGEIT